MTHDDINAVLAHADELWPRRITGAHREACYQAWERIPCHADGARVALNALAVEFKGYVTVAHITERVRSAAYGSASDEKTTRRQEEQDARRQADMEHQAIVERDDAATVHWLAGLDQEDIDELVRYILRTCGPAAKALLELGKDNKLPKRVAEERRNVRAILHAAERQMQ